MNLEMDWKSRGGRVGTEEALTWPQFWHVGMHTHWQQGMLGMQQWSPNPQH